MLNEIYKIYKISEIETESIEYQRHGMCCSQCINKNEFVILLFGGKSNRTSFFQSFTQLSIRLTNQNDIYCSE